MPYKPNKLSFSSGFAQYLPQLQKNYEYVIITAHFLAFLSFLCGSLSPGVNGEIFF